MIPFEFGAVALDTNVIIYALDRDVQNPKVVAARQILRRAGHFSPLIPLQVAAETFSVLTARFGWTKVAARDAIAQLLSDLPQSVTTVDTTLSAMSLCAKQSVAFWDAMIITGSAAGGCGAVLTEDFQDGRRFDPPDVARRIQIIDPFEPTNRPILQAIGAFDGAKD